jgi:hypothetical protein
VAGFTGGNATNRPTATDETIWMNANQFINISQSTPQTTVLHVMMSSTGEQTRILVCSQSTVVMQWFFEKLADSALSNPVVHNIRSNGSNLINDYMGTARWVGKKGSTTFNGFTGAEYYYSTYVVNALGGAIPDITGGYPITPLSVHSETTNAKGRCGRMVDIWGGSPSIGIGGTYPASPDNKEFVQFNQWIFPWNSTTPVIL